VWTELPGSPRGRQRMCAGGLADRDACQLRRAVQCLGSFHGPH
jgi:hypothetical protein